MNEDTIINKLLSDVTLLQSQYSGLHAEIAVLLQNVKTMTAAGDSLAIKIDNLSNAILAQTARLSAIESKKSLWVNLSDFLNNSWKFLTLIFMLFMFLYKYHIFDTKEEFIKANNRQYQDFMKDNK